MGDSDDDRSERRTRSQPSQSGDRQGLDQNKQSRFPYHSAPSYSRQPSRQGMAPPPTAQGAVPDRQTPSMPSRESSSPAFMPRQLCPGLVVLRSNECLLAVPTLTAVGVPPRRSASF